MGFALPRQDLQDGQKCTTMVHLSVLCRVLCEWVVNTRANATNVCLVPKNLSSLSLKGYRSISLITCSYKIIG